MNNFKIIIVLLFFSTIINAQNIPKGSKNFNNLTVYLVSEGKDKKIKTEEKQSFESSSEIEILNYDGNYGIMLKSNYLTDGKRSFFYVSGSKKIVSEKNHECYLVYTNDEIIKPSFNICYSNIEGDLKLGFVQYFYNELMFKFN